MSLTNSSLMLQYLDKLLEKGNYTKAAKDLFISQPYLTQVIKKTEKSLGVSIINRQADTIQLTNAGSLYYRYLERLESEKNHLHRQIALFNQPQDAIIRISILSSLGHFILPEFLPTFMSKYPHVKVIIEEDLPQNNENKAIKNEVDFYIGQTPETVSPQLKLYSGKRHAYYAIIPKTSPLYQANQHIILNASLEFSHILNQPLVITASGSAIRRQIDQLMNQFKIIPNILLESENIYTVAELSKNGLAIGIVPENILNLDEKGPFNLYPIDTDYLSLRYFIGHNVSRELNEIDSLFLNHFMRMLDALHTHIS